MARRRPAGRVAISWVLAAALAACASETTTPSPSPTPAPLATPVVTTYSLETTAWVEGLVVTVHGASASLDAKGGPVTVTMRIDNRGADVAALDVPIRLTASGYVFNLVNGTVLPDVDAGASAEVSLVFEVDSHSSIDDGVLRIGRPGDHQVQIPFSTGPIPSVTLKPDAASLSGAVMAGGLRLALRRREVRWDLPDWYQELPLGNEALTLTYDVTYVGTFTGGIAFTGANVRLQLPDGRLVAPRKDGHSQSVVLVGLGKTAKNLISRFEIPNGTSGALGLLVTDGSNHRIATFKIGP
ncbi:MAG TPA: hypothetical protein VGQ85_06455 [Candidatus Limnocylindrales bacterium]|nr:hypothetical protein [Candidatus Limnocylindrales bacterium]